MPKQDLVSFNFGGSGLSDEVPLRGEVSAFAPGSRNLMPYGANSCRPMRSATLLTGKLGVNQMFPVKNTWGGLSDYTIGSNVTKGQGSLFAWLAELLVFCGAGQVNVEGENITGAIATNQLQFCLKSGSGYGSPIVAGMSQPSAPSIAAVANPGGVGGAPTMNGTYSVKIARIRSTTGGRSRASATSATVQINTGQVLSLTFPAAADGQTGWVVFVTRADFGGVGLHYRLVRANPVSGTEYTEAQVDALPGRQVFLNWTESDILDESAWIADFPPPPSSHAFAIENVFGVVCYGDSNTDASATNPGSTIAFSLPNFPESYNPLHLLYLPEKVISVLGRGMDSYVFVGCRNAIFAVQYVNAGGAGVPATLTAMMPDEGINNHHNWTIRQRGVYLFTNKSGAVRIIEGGQVDKTFATPVRRIMSRWLPENVVVAAAPFGDGIAYFHRNTALFYDERTGRWSSLLYLSDLTTDKVINAVSTRGELVYTLKSGTPAVLTVSTFDSNESGTVAATAIGHYTNQPAPGRTKTVTEISAAFVAGTEAGAVLPVYLSLHRNNRPTYLADGKVTAGTGEFETVVMEFDAGYVGSYVLLYLPGAGSKLTLARVKQVLTNKILLLGTATQDLSDSVTLNFGATASGLFALLAHRIYRIFPQLPGAQEIKPLEPYVRGNFSLAAGLTVQGECRSDRHVQPLDVILRGSINKEGRSGSSSIGTSAGNYGGGWFYPEDDSIDEEGGGGPID